MLGLLVGLASTLAVEVCSGVEENNFGYKMKINKNKVTGSLENE